MSKKDNTEIYEKDKISRICWNDESWVKPSGSLGKSKNKDSYEHINGYGHEEWLLDTTKIIDGYHYASLQSIGKHRDLYENKEFNISLYSINNDTKQRWWLGEIKNIKVITKKESIEVYNKYQENGWYDEMEDQLSKVGASVDAFRKFTTPESFAVIKFRVSDLNLLKNPAEFSAKDTAVKGNHYVLLSNKKTPGIKGATSFSFKKGHKQGKGKAKSSYSEHKSEIDLVHNKLQTFLYNKLVKVHGKDNVGTENIANKMSRIDLVVKKKSTYIFYEIKTNASVRLCIREAIGQLLEYFHYSGEKKISKLVIASQNVLCTDEKLYISTLRKQYSLPIYYQHIDLKNKYLPKIQ